MASTVFGGLISGIDTEALIQATLGSEAIPKLRLEARQEKFNAQAVVYDSLASKLTALDTALKAMDTANEIQKRKAVDPASGSVTLTVTDGAPDGVHTIEIETLAKRETEVSGNYTSDENTGLTGTGILKIIVAGSENEITISDGADSLNGVMNAINNAAIGVTATVIQDGDATKPYRLMIYADTGGAAQSIVFDVSELAGGSPNLSFSEAVAGTDANVTIDGIEVTSATNEITTFLPNTTIALHKTTTTADTFEIQNDKDGTADLIADMVQKYNDVVNSVRTDVSSEGKLASEVVAQTVGSRLRDALHTDAGAGGIESIGEIGIKSESTGSITFSSSDFHDAVSESKTDVLDFITGTNGLVATLLSQVDELGKTTTGTVPSRAKALRERATNLQDEIDRYQERLDKREETLRRKYADLEQFLSKIQSQSSALAMFNTSSN